MKNQYCQRDKYPRTLHREREVGGIGRKTSGKKSVVESVKEEEKREDVQNPEKEKCS